MNRNGIKWTSDRGDGLIEEDGILGQWHVRFLGMLLIVETETPDSLDI